MLQPFKYMFYRLYAFNMKSWKDSEMAASQALAGVCMSITLNSLSVFCWIDVFFGTKFEMRFFSLPKIDTYAISLIPALLFFIYWAPENKYMEIIRGFEKVGETNTQKFRRMIYILAYIVFSIIFGFISIAVAYEADKVR